MALVIIMSVTADVVVQFPKNMSVVVSLFLLYCSLLFSCYQTDGIMLASDRQICDVLMTFFSFRTSCTSLLSNISPVVVSGTAVSAL